MACSENRPMLGNLPPTEGYSPYSGLGEGNGQTLLGAMWCIALDYIRFQSGNSRDVSISAIIEYHNSV